MSSPSAFPYPYPVAFHPLPRGADPWHTPRVAFLGDCALLREPSTGAYTLSPQLGAALAAEIRPDQGELDETWRSRSAFWKRAVTPDGGLQHAKVYLPPAASAEGEAWPSAFPGHVFVYGTLMSGEERHGFIERVCPGATIERAHTLGSLVHLGAWPGMLAGSETVHGELLRPRDMGALLRALDPVEDFEGYAHEPTEYVRVVLPVQSGRGVVSAWAYRYVGPLHGSRPIPSGRWRDAPRRLPGH